MKFNRYKNLWNKDMVLLDQEVNEYISKGCMPIGGVSVIVGDRKVIHVQTVILDSNENNVLGEFVAEAPYIEEVRRLAVDTKLRAIKLLMEKTGMQLKEAKDWVDSNC